MNRTLKIILKTVAGIVVLAIVLVVSLKGIFGGGGGQPQ